MERAWAMSEAGVNSLHLTIVSDYICPWCYIGTARVRRLVSEYDVTTEYVPYELRPETPPEGLDFALLRGRGRYTEEYLAEVKALAEASGLTMAERRFIPNSRLALEAAEWARATGGFQALHDALFSAYFARGADIGRPAVLRELAEEAGLDGEALAVALSEGRHRPVLEEKLGWSRVAGMGGVPLFIFKALDPASGEVVKRFGFTGAQDYDVFESIMARLGIRRRE
jgi:predicted DsbA family dithiol-disulfide isomerase